MKFDRLKSISFIMNKYFSRTIKEKIEKNKRLIEVKDNQNFSTCCANTIQSGNFAVIIYCYFNSQVCFYIIPFVIFSRVYSYCNYIFDATLGALVGILSSGLIYRLMFLF